MSVPLLDQQQPPPPPLETTVPQEPYGAHSGHGSVGPVIAVLTVIIIFGALAAMLGRLCYGRKIMCRDYYDVEGWVERKCSACIDGRINITPPRPSVSGSSLPSPPIPAAPPAAQETGEETPPRQPSS